MSTERRETYRPSLPGVQLAQGIGVPEERVAVVGDLTGDGHPLQQAACSKVTAIRRSRAKQVTTAKKREKRGRYFYSTVASDDRIGENRRKDPSYRQNER